MGIELQPAIRQSQKLTITQALCQSFQVLKMPVLDLREHLLQAVTENPLLEMESAGESFESLPAEDSDDADGEFWDDENRFDGSDVPVAGLGRSRDFSGEYLPGAQMAGEDFTDMLLGQIALLRLHTRDMALCRYLVACLNESGYLDVPLEEIAAELHVSLFDVQQALYIIQSLQPTGVGARSLSECLLLQLVESPHFNSITIRLVKDGLSLLAQRDMPGLAALLGTSEEKALDAAEIVRALNPIPSRGFNTGGTTSYVVPDASVVKKDGSFAVELNDAVLPHVHISEETCALLRQSDESGAAEYYRKNYAQATALLRDLRGRQDTLSSILARIVARQPAFLAGGPLEAMTMKDLADELGISVSTVSRACSGKYLSVNGALLPVRRLFCTSVSEADGERVSGGRVRRQIRVFIDAENPAKPLSDEDLRAALAAMGIAVSRRVVAKYREEMHIPSSRQRRKQPMPDGRNEYVH